MYCGNDETTNVDVRQEVGVTNVDVRQEVRSQTSFLHLGITDKPQHKPGNTFKWNAQSPIITVKANSRSYIRVRQDQLKSNTQELETDASMKNGITDLDATSDEEQCTIATGNEPSNEKHEPSNESDVAKPATNEPMSKKQKYADFNWLRKSAEPEAVQWRSSMNGLMVSVYTPSA